MPEGGFLQAGPDQPTTAGTAPIPQLTPMRRHTLRLLAIPLVLTACGVGETAATAAAVGTTRATHAAQARQVLDAVQQQLDLGAREAQERLRAAEAASR